MSQKQTRYCEGRDHIPRAARSVCVERFYRRFMAEQVQAIKIIKQCLDRRFTLAQAARVPEQSNRKENPYSGRLPGLPAPLALELLSLLTWNSWI